MRVLKTVQSYFPFQERGGTAFKVRAIARGLARRGHHVTVLTADLGIRSGDRAGRFERCEWGWRFSEDGVDAIYLSTTGRYRALTWNPRAMRFCEASLGYFDLLHVYGLYDLLGPVAAWVCRRNDIPYIVEPMGMYRPIVRNLMLKRMYRWLVGARLVAHARFVVATSEQEERELAASGLPPERITVRRNGIDVPRSLPPRGGFRGKWSIPAEAQVILFLGRLVSKKRPDLLIRAFADWKRNRADRQNGFLLMAGAAEDNRYLEHLTSLARSVRAAGSVRFVGPLYDEEKWSAYRDADVFVLPSENENFGNAAAEAAACGTPVIVTNCCGVAPFLEPAGLIVSPDRTEIANALERLLGDPAVYERCRKGCAQLSASLSWDAPLGALEALYQQCGAARSAQPVVA